MKLKFFTSWLFRFYQLHFFNGSEKYWKSRYASGGNSGAGSYNRLSVFKSEVINEFVSKNGINNVIEWGCGDGNQLSLAKYPHYIGIDIAQEAIKACQKRFDGDISKTFICSGVTSFNFNGKAELTLSLDVIYHLVEDSVFDTYMKRLFESSTRYVCIYSCNDENNEGMRPHVKHRIFSDWIDKEYSNQWQLIKFIKNKYPYDVKDKNNTSWSDFYFYEKINNKVTI